MIYLLTAIIFIFFSLDEVYKYNIQKSRNLIVLLGLWLILMAGLRWEVGTDWLAYYRFYVYGVDDIEKGYSFLNNLFRTELGLNYTTFLIFMNGLAITLLIKSANKISPLPILALLLFFCDLFLYFNLSGLRQAMATAFTCFSLLYAYGSNRNLAKFLITVFLGSLFHITALVFVIAYFIPQRPLTKKELFVTLLGFASFSTVIYFVSTFLTGVFATKAEYYLEVQEKAMNIQQLFMIGLARRLIPFFLVLIYARSRYFLSPLRSYLFNLYSIGLGIFASSYLISPDIGVRVSSYFIILEIFMLGHLVYILGKRKGQWLILLVIYAVAIYKISTYMDIPAYDYKSIFD